MSLKSLILLSLTGAMIIFVACKEDNLVTTVDPDVQREIDLEIINDYIAEQGYDFNPSDTTASGVRFVILEEGAGAPIEFGDIVDLHYVGRFTDRELFTTTIDTVDINNDSYDSLARYRPITFTQSETGWALTQKFSNTQMSNSGLPFPRGFFDGVTKALTVINIGGRAEIIIPSGLAYGTSVSTVSPFRNKVLVFELYPVYKR